MKPKTVSATSLATASDCLARYKAEAIDRTPRSGNNSAANVGSAVHNALESYVKGSQIDRTAPATWQVLEMMYRMAYADIFQSSDYDTPEFKDGLELARKWHGRTSFDDIEVLSVEVKEQMMIPTSQGIIPFTFIYDRLDRIHGRGKNIYRVVDYKTIRGYLSPEDLLSKIQARCYSVAARLKLQNMNLDVDEIWVEFDMLRFEPVRVIFSPDADKATWRWIKDSVERILDWPDDKWPPESIGAGCRWCVRKTNCQTLIKNSAGGGITLLATPAQLASRLDDLNNAAAAIKYAKEEVEGALLADMQNRDALELEDDGFLIEVSAYKRRVISDVPEAAAIIGPELMSQFGSLKIGDVDKLVKSEGLLTDDQKAALKKTMTSTFGEPSVKVKELKPFKP